LVLEIQFDNGFFELFVAFDILKVCLECLFEDFRPVFVCVISAATSAF